MALASMLCGLCVCRFNRSKSVSPHNWRVSFSFAGSSLFSVLESVSDWFVFISGVSWVLGLTEPSQVFSFTPESLQ